MNGFLLFPFRFFLLCSGSLAHAGHALIVGLAALTSTACRLLWTMFWFDHDGDGKTRMRAFISLITPNHTGMFQSLGKRNL